MIATVNKISFVLGSGCDHKPSSHSHSKVFFLIFFFVTLDRSETNVVGSQAHFRICTKIRGFLSESIEI